MHDAALLVLATGGTIAGQAGSAARMDYRPGQIDIADFLTAFAALGMPAKLEGRQIANIDSVNIDATVWRALHAAAMAAINDPACDGIIVTHGTDTAEETAFLLDQTLPTAKPVVLVGAMHPADAVGSDGLRNFANAVRVASDPAAAGRGVLVVMGDQVLAARDARKGRTRGTDAFRGFPRGAVALANPASVDWLQPPWRLGEAARCAFPEEFPRVEILHVHAGMGADIVERAVAAGARGIVLAGAGEGNAPDTVFAALAEAASKGVVVIRSSRTDEGLVDRWPQDDTAGFVAARALNPAKARILAQLLIANGVTEIAAVQDAFNRR